jgi:tetratricopeptide (TPR) repeat protein
MADELRRADVLLSLRRYTEAAEIAYRVAAREPGDPRPLLTAARAELGLGANDRAEAAACGALRYAPELAFGHRLVAVARINRGMASGGRVNRHWAGRSAIEPAQRAVGLDPHQVAGYWVLAQATAMAGQLNEAKGLADECVRMAPQDPESWRVRAYVARLVRDLPVAEACAKEALRLDPQHYGAGNELGLVYQDGGKTGRSLNQFAATAAIDPIRSPARTNIVRHAMKVTYFGALILLCPLAIIWPVWVAAAVGLNQLVWRWKVTKPSMERFGSALARRHVRRAQKKGNRAARSVPPGTAINGPYALSTFVLWCLFGGVLVCFALPTTVGLFTQTLTFVLPATIAWAVTVTLAVVLRRRRRRGPSVVDQLGVNQEATA